MADEPKPSSPEQPPSDAPSVADYAAIGIGCLVFVIIIGAAMYLGFSRG